MFFLLLFLSFLFFSLTIFFLNSKFEKDKLDQQKKEEMIERCSKYLENISYENWGYVAEKINNFSQDEKSIFFRELSKKRIAEFLLVKYLGCIYKKERDEQKKQVILEMAANLVNVPQHDKIFNYEFVNAEESFIKNLAVGDLANICPTVLTKMCNKARDIYLKEDEFFCQNICQLIEKYEEEPNLFQQEIFLMKEKNLSLNLKGLNYDWRLAMAFRLGGRPEMEKFCLAIFGDGNLDECFSVIAKNEVRFLSCEEAKNFLNREICFQ